jgi:hypothetical protein
MEVGDVVLPLSAMNGSAVSYVVFIGADQAICYELMAVWGLVIALCVLFSTSAISAGFLFLGKKRSLGLKQGLGNTGSSGPDGARMDESQMEMARPKPSFSRSPSLRENGALSVGFGSHAPVGLVSRSEDAPRRFGSPATTSVGDSRSPSMAPRRSFE